MCIGSFSFSPISQERPSWIFVCDNMYHCFLHVISERYCGVVFKFKFKYFLGCERQQLGDRYILFYKHVYTYFGSRQNSKNYTSYRNLHIYFISQRCLVNVINPFYITCFVSPFFFVTFIHFEISLINLHSSA